MSRIEHLSGEVKGNSCEYLGWLAMEPDAVAATYGIEFVDTCDGLEELKLANVRDVQTGKIFGLSRHLNQSPGSTSIYSVAETANRAEDLKIFMEMLGIGLTDLAFVPDDILVEMKV